MIADVLPLLRTLFDIIRLRKGPEAIPHSSVLFVMILVAWIAAGELIVMLIVELDQSDFAISIALGVVALLLYALVVVSSQRSSRLLQTLTAILGCGVLLQCFFIVSYSFLTPVLGRGIAGVVSYLLLLWSVPVEGHIIARTIDRQWYVGFLVALAVFLIQIQLSSFFGPADLARP
jgi:hypothetical protein